MDSVEDSELVAQIIERKVDALGTYIQKNREPLLAFIRAISSSRLLSAVELDDLFQDVSITAVQGLASAPLDRYAPIEWIQQIARRRVIDSHRFHFEAQRRSASKQQSIHASADDGPNALGIEHLLVASVTTPSAIVSQNVRLMRMQEALRSLTEEQQLIIRLRYVDNLPTKQIAAQLEKTDGAIRVLLSRSIRQLEDLLRDVKPSR